MKALVILSLFVFSTAFADNEIPDILDSVCTEITLKIMSPEIPGVTSQVTENRCYISIDGVPFKDFDITDAQKALEEDASRNADVNSNPNVKLTYTPENIQAEKTCAKMAQEAIQPLEPHAAFVSNGACMVTVIGKTFADGTKSPQAGKHFTLEMPQDNL